MSSVTVIEPIRHACHMSRLKAWQDVTNYGRHPRIQILTIWELFEGKQPNIPLVDTPKFKKAARESGGEQDLLPL